MSSRKVSEYLLCVQELKSSLHIMRRAARLLNRIFIDLCIQQLVNWLQKRIAAPRGAAVWILLFGSAVLGAVYGISALPAPSQNPAGLFLAAPPLLFAALLLHRPSYGYRGLCIYTGWFAASVPAPPTPGNLLCFNAACPPQAICSRPHVPLPGAVMHPP